MQRLIVIGCAMFSLFGCATPSVKIHDQSQQVELRLDEQFNPSNCQYLGEVTGSEGHWYSYLFFTNDAMLQGAVIDLKNNAAALGANTIDMIAPQDFTTSFSVLGTAYHCK